MDYNEMFDIVKKQNPKMPYKEKQALAKQMYANFKENLKNFGTGSSKSSVKAEEGVIPVGASTPDLMKAEKRIRAGQIDVNAVISIGREVIPDGALVRHGKEGVNTWISFENPDGSKKLPEIGYFLVFMI